MSRLSTPFSPSGVVRFSSFLFGKSYSDVVLAILVVAIVGLMILPLPLLIVDILVAINMLIALGLLLLAIYIPRATAFSSFPSVILISTLFRLSLSISITRLILMDGEAGDIIDTFGNLVVGGNVVVGLVVFTIITVVQFIVIAKGAERVAEVSARFTLDAMPGKQMSIDSDLRSGLLSKEDAREKRKLLEVESQLHGSMDGAMKFVKGDAIAGIVILLVNIVGGLTIGMMQNGLSFSDAAQTYTILTVGDGLVSQIPALLTSISAGLIITRSSQDDEHLGASISSQVSAYPKVTLIGGLLAFLLATIPGFPWLVFLVIGLILLMISLTHYFPGLTSSLRLPLAGHASNNNATERDNSDCGAPQDLKLDLPTSCQVGLDTKNLQEQLGEVTRQLGQQYGLSLPQPLLTFSSPSSAPQGHETNTRALEARILAFDAKIGPPLTLSVPIQPEQLIDAYRDTLQQHLGVFMGIQETANLITQWNQRYPDLIKEALRAITPLRMSEVLRGLLEEQIPVRDLRTILESFTAHAPQEKDTEQLIEKVRTGLRRQISERFSTTGSELTAFLVNPEFEYQLRKVLSDRSAQQQEDLQKLITHFQSDLATHMSNLKKTVENNQPVILLSASDVRRIIRQFTQKKHPAVVVLAFQELADTLSIHSLGQIA